MSHDIPAPSRSDWLGRFVCKAQVQIPMGASGLTQPCDERFWFYANYEVHWLQEHAPAKALPKVEPGQGPGSLSLEEEGRRLASRRDDLIALGVPPELLEIPIAPGHYISRVHHCQHPDCIAKNQTHIAREDTP